MRGVDKIGMNAAWESLIALLRPIHFFALLRHMVLRFLRRRTLGPVGYVTFLPLIASIGPALIGRWQCWSGEKETTNECKLRHRVIRPSNRR